MDVDQVESAWLTGDTEWMNFLAEFDVQFFAPVEERNMKMTWATMTEQEKAILKQIEPYETRTKY